VLSSVSKQNQPGFIARQFRLPVTPTQKAFDLVFGIIFPLGCILADPIVFHGSSQWMQQRGILQPYRVAAYAVTAASIAMLAIVLLNTRRMPSAFLGGGMLASSLFALGVACLLVPFSLIGVFFFGIGLLGFTPFLTGFVYFRNAIRLSVHGKRAGKLLADGCGFLFVAALPLALQMVTDRAANHLIEKISTGLPADALHARETYFRWQNFLDGDRILDAYSKNNDEEMRRKLASAYAAIAGKDIQTEISERNAD
jgi:hypothetical protein